MYVEDVTVGGVLAEKPLRFASVVTLVVRREDLEYVFSNIA
jgi:hypothetical protein